MPQHHCFHDIPPEEEQQLRNLFKKLDINKDGVIDIVDLTEALQTLKVPQLPGQAESIIKGADRNMSQTLDFEEFMIWVTEHEKKLKLAFHHIDANQDGRIDAHELMVSLRKLGMTIDLIGAEELIQRMDKDGTLTINWLEWRDHLLFHPSSNIHDILHYWRHSSIIDIGEDSLVPDDFTERELLTGVWWKHLVAGAAAGAVSRTCTAPLDRLKVFLQVHGTKSNKLGIVSGARYMLAEGGLKSMWRGNGINVVKIAPESALKFMAYEQVKRLIKGNTNRELGVLERFISGSTAGAISQSTIYPMEVLKTRLALRKTGQYKGVWDCATKLYKHEGIGSFYRGYLPNLLGIIPYAGIDLAVYETLKRFYIKSHAQNSDPGILVLLVCGTVSSTCGQLASYPLALVRTKLQAKVMSHSVSASAYNSASLTLHPDTGGKRETMRGLFKHIIKTEGFTGLYRGITPNFMKVAPAVSISYVVYEHMRKALGVQMT